MQLPTTFLKSYGVLGLIISVAFIVYLTISIFKEIASGVVRAKIRRSERPLRYWSIVGSEIVALVIWILILVVAATEP
jgi:hypothetical protein